MSTPLDPLVADVVHPGNLPNDADSESDVSESDVCESDISDLELGISVSQSGNHGEHESDSDNASRNGLCRRCCMIDPTFIHSPKYIQPVQLGRVDKLSTRNCSFCQYLFRLLMVEPKVYGHIRTSKKAYLFSLADGEAPLSLRVGNSERAKIYVEDLIDEGTRLTPPTIGLSPLSPILVRQWLTECKRGHGDHCSTTSGSDDIDIHLIDVNRLCLVSASTSCRYIALSYVVGGQTSLQLVKSNILQLLEDNALTPDKLSAINEKSIPQAVQDAIVLVKSLKEDFLWVDSLCIVQDDAMIKHKQIMNMDTIYSRALLTIVSVSGDNSNCGLPGVRPDARQPINLSTDLNGYKILGQPPDIRDILASSPYETRGWTFQERILSPRCLYLSKWQAYFQCNGGFQSEYCCITRRASDSTTLQSSAELHDRIKRLHRYREPYRTTNTPPLHGIQQDFSCFLDNIPKMFLNYADLAEQYTQRHLSFKSDILNAFGGITSAMERNYQTRFIYGLPVDAMERALLWSPIGPRKARGSILSGASEVTLPTWSWAAWEGLIGYHTIDQQSLDTRLSCMSEINLVSDGDWGSDSTLTFWATTADMSQFLFSQRSQGRSSDRVTQIILNSTQCGNIFVDDDVIRRNLPGGGNRELVMISSSTLSSTLSHSSTGVATRDPAKFIMPNYGYPRNKVAGTYLSMFDMRKLPHEAGLRCIVHVLLVQWNGDVAERVAVGLMHRDAWDEVRTTRKLVKVV